MGAPLAPLEFWFEGGPRQVAPFLFLFLGLNLNNLVLFSFHIALVLRVRRGCLGVWLLRLACSPSPHSSRLLGLPRGRDAAGGVALGGRARTRSNLHNYNNFYPA